MDLSEFVRENAPKLMVYLQAVFLLLVFGLVAFYVRQSNRASQFKLREADRMAAKKKKARGEITNAPPAPKTSSEKMRALPGIDISGSPAEILGVSNDASIKEINRAYRDLMKRYHPDKIGRAGSAQWQEAQKIAEAINHARDVLIKAKV